MEQDRCLMHSVQGKGCHNDPHFLVRMKTALYNKAEVKFCASRFTVSVGLLNGRIRF
jgi:hypothetical protein